MRDRYPAGDQADTEAEQNPWLVQLGGWHEALAWRELVEVAETVVRLGSRLALVEGDMARLQHLGGSRSVFRSLGATDRVEVPPAVARALVGSFAVRFVDRDRLLGDAERRRLTALVWRAHPRPVVALESPRHEVVVFVEADQLVFGERAVDCSLALRARTRRPFARSYEMPPRLARILVNISGARAGEYFLDPFCGTGSLVIEAASIGAQAIGGDVDRSAVHGAALNATHDHVFGRFAVADATRPWLRERSVGAVAADLPYGRSASRRGIPGTRLVETTLDGLSSTVKVGARVVLVTLDDSTPRHLSTGWDEVWSITQPARTVTRRITSWRKQ